jgi:hypothetical protein
MVMQVKTWMTSFLFKDFFSFKKNKIQGASFNQIDVYWF